MINEYLISTQTGPSDNNTTLTEAPLPQSLNSIFITPTTENEVLSTINGLKNKISSGFDNFNTILIKNIASEISSILTHVINLSFLNSVFPEQLKLSVVVPIFKKGTSVKLDNLRPISLLSIFSKIFEKKS